MGRKLTVRGRVGGDISIPEGVRAQGGAVLQREIDRQSCNQRKLPVMKVTGCLARASAATIVRLEQVDNCKWRFVGGSPNIIPHSAISRRAARRRGVECRRRMPVGFVQSWQDREEPTAQCYHSPTRLAHWTGELRCNITLVSSGRRTMLPPGG